MWDKVRHSDHPVSLLARYVIAGLSVGLIYVLFGYILSDKLGFSMPIAVTVSYIVTTPLAFTLQKRFTFKSKQALEKEVPRFVVVATLLLVASKLAKEYVTLPVPLMVQLVTFWFLGSLLNFLAYKFWVFSHRQ